MDSRGVLACFYPQKPVKQAKTPIESIDTSEMMQLPRNWIHSYFSKKNRIFVLPSKKQKYWVGTVGEALAKNLVFAIKPAGRKMHFFGFPKKRQKCICCFSIFLTWQNFQKVLCTIVWPLERSQSQLMSSLQSQLMSLAGFVGSLTVSGI